MGSPISPLIANLFIEEFQVKAICSAFHPAQLWLRYVEDTLVIQQAEHCHQFLQYINSLKSQIKLITEDPKEDSSMSFLDTLLSPGLNRPLQLSFIRNQPTWTNTYIGTAATSS